MVVCVWCGRSAGVLKKRPRPSRQRIRWRGTDDTQLAQPRRTLYERNHGHGKRLVVVAGSHIQLELETPEGAPHGAHVVHDVCVHVYVELVEMEVRDVGAEDGGAEDERGLVDAEGAERGVGVIAFALQARVCHGDLECLLSLEEEALDGGVPQEKIGLVTHERAAGEGEALESRMHGGEGHSAGAAVHGEVQRELFEVAERAEQASRCTQSQPWASGREIRKTKDMQVGSFDRNLTLWKARTQTSFSV
ncbi:hypothetical protein B0H14DRAFT_2985243 [Mycena olivaceomarginata]|nr:hypothetical protein B0H14DRAFT_2985243 [Mycena olivaceomarginata]